MLAVNSSFKTLRIMIRGKNLDGAKVEWTEGVVGVSNPISIESGRYLFLESKRIKN
jgi:hypothetical protein